MTHEEDLKKTIQYADSRLKKMPEGTLSVRKYRGGIYYYSRNPGVNEREKYLGKNDTELIRQLQEKGYLEELKDAAEKELKALKQIEKIKSKMPNAEAVFMTLPENRKSLIKPYDSAETVRVRERIGQVIRFWNQETNDRKTVDFKLNLVTLNGERVRSKSELIIADRLYKAGVPYYYEGRCVFEHEDTMSFDVWYPDFQIFNKRTGQMFYWEHFGMMDRPEYCDSCQFKLETYAKNGIFPGKNLIVTMETSHHPLNTDYVDSLIKEFLQ